MADFEAQLARLEELTNDIKRTDIPLEDALKDFEEGIKLAKGLEKALDAIEGKIQILMNEPNPETPENMPELDDFDDSALETGTSGAPVSGTRQ